MSVRVTERLIGDVVIASGLTNSPLMVVQSIVGEAKLVNTIWFSDGKECQEGTFPASALDRVEPQQGTLKAKKSPSGKAGAPGRKAGK